MLTDDQKTILDIESSWWRYAAAKDAVIRERLNMSPTRYYQVLHVLLRNPEAAQFAPLAVNRLLRLETARRAVRSAGRMPTAR